MIKIHIEIEGADELLADPRVAALIGSLTTVPPPSGDPTPVTYVDDKREWELQRSQDASS
jgi:hypothetical protein